MRLLVIRTSAMGDVALVTPVLRALMKQYPEAEVVLLTRAAFKPFFHSFGNLNLFFIDVKNRHKGFKGLIRLFADLRKSGRFDKVIDLHDVLRTKILRALFSLAGVPSFIIDKGRKEKRSVISGTAKKKLLHSVERYISVFRKAGFSLTPDKGPWILPSPVALLKVEPLIASGDELKVGVAPYARHKLKLWPEDYMIRLLGMISETRKTRFYFFGGNEESEKLAAISSKVEGSYNTNGKLSLDEELALMSRLDLMIAMDSSNMHMAALTGIRVISIWGGTDPLTGFGAWMQPDDHFLSIPVNELTCRPCTVYGKGECKRGDLACMYRLIPEMVFGRIRKLGIL